MNTRTCRWPECDRPATSKGFCPRDYQRAKREGDYETPWLTWQRVYPPHIECRWPDCERTDHEGHGLCALHWSRAKRVGDLEAPWATWAKNICQGCGKEFRGRNHRQKHCSDRCAVLAWQRQNPERYAELGRRHASQRRARIAATAVEDFTEADVRMAHGDDCYLCGDRINFKLKWPHPKSPSLDHIVPLSRGGTHTLDNVAMACLSCNHSKNARPATSTPIPTLFAP